MQAHSLRSTLNPPRTGRPTPTTNKCIKQTAPPRPPKAPGTPCSRDGRPGAAAARPARRVWHAFPRTGGQHSTEITSSPAHTPLPCLTPLRCGPDLAAAGSALSPHQHMLHLQAGVVELARQPVHQLRQRPPCNPACAHQLLVGAGASAGCETPSVGSIACSCWPVQRFCWWLTMQLTP